VCVCV